MDHLPQPASPFEPLRVPYLEGPAYTPPFDTFPTRNDCELRGGLRPYPYSTNSHKLLQVHQSWVFFGILQDFLTSAGLRYDYTEILDDFLCDDKGACREEPESLAENWGEADALRYTEPGGTQALKTYWKGTATNTGTRSFVTTKRLWWYLSEAIIRLRGSLDLENALAQLESRLVVSLSAADSIESYFPKTIEHRHNANPAQVEFENRFLAISLSVHSLRQALIQAKMSLENNEGMEINRGSTLLARRMARQGWCPYQSAWVAHSFSTVSSYYISLLGPPRPLACHLGCDARSCRLLQMDESKYKVAHRCAKKSCGIAAPDQDEMCRILQEEGIPIIVIRYETERAGSVGLHIKVERYKTGREFYAISHVWSDGMGNPKENSLPLCQLHALASTTTEARRLGEAEKSSSEVAIWMDTLCIPLVPQVRKLAIQRMKATYAQATRVLVFDSALQQSKLQGATRLEQGYRVLASNWQRRLWTLQEAVFARKLVFKFADGLLFFEDFSANSKTVTADFATKEMRVALNYFCTGHYHAEDIQGMVNQAARIDRFIATMPHFCHRTTSRMTDESLCLATLLDADVGAILEAPDADRFRRVLDHQRGFAPNIIFLHGPKMPDEPYRWAPSTFMYPWDSMQRTCFTPMPLPTSATAGKTKLVMRMATITPYGLLVDLPVIYIKRDVRGSISGSEFLIDTTTSRGRKLLHMATVPEDGSDSGGVQPTLTFSLELEKEDETNEKKGTSSSRSAGGTTAFEPTHAILLIHFVGVPMPGHKRVTSAQTLGLIISNLAPTSMHINGQATDVVTGRCEERVTLAEVEHRPELLKRLGREIRNEEGSVRGIDISEKGLRAFMVEDRLVKVCIR